MLMRILLSVLIAVLIFSSDTGRLKIAKVTSFPDTDQFKDKNGNHVDVGYCYVQRNLFGLPLWNEEGRWCGYIGKADTFLDLNKESLDAFAHTVGMSLPTEYEAPLWERIGGKIIVAVLILSPLASTRKKRETEKVPV